MSRKDVLKKFAAPARSETDYADWIKQNAADFAKQWKEDCYVYGDMVWGGSVVYTQGPDADHPKTTPTFIAKYVAPAKKGVVS